MVNVVGEEKRAHFHVIVYNITQVLVTPHEIKRRRKEQNNNRFFAFIIVYTNSLAPTLCRLEKKNFFFFNIYFPLQFKCASSIAKKRSCSTFFVRAPAI